MMGNRLTKIYTRTGDDGTTGMADGSRISKADLVFEVMGDIDELNSHIGMIRALLSEQGPNDLEHEDTGLVLGNTDNRLKDKATDKITQIDKSLSILQHLLFNIGGELAMPNYTGVEQAHIDWLESSIDTMNENLPSLKDFILPAGSPLCVQVHIARSICRRAERKIVSLKTQNSDSMGDFTPKFINRLSDWLFVFARETLRMTNVNEVLWDKEVLTKI